MMRKYGSIQFQFALSKDLLLRWFQVNFLREVIQSCFKGGVDKEGSQNFFKKKVHFLKILDVLQINDLAFTRSYLKCSVWLTEVV